jgi:NTP pyrophosphatase (non-canonical NTP hydrolase)
VSGAEPRGMERAVTDAVHLMRDGGSMTHEHSGPDSLERLNARLLRFAQERDWEQFQSPKNLAMALAGEAGELLEHFQWLTEEQSADLSPEKRRAVGYELADILNYLVRLAQRLDIDLLAVTDEKIAINERRYPADKVRGDARRASEYED